MQTFLHDTHTLHKLFSTFENKILQWQMKNFKKLHTNNLKSLANVKKPDLKEKEPIFAYILIHRHFSYLHSHVWCSTKVISTYSLSVSNGLNLSSWGTKASSDDQYTKLQLAQKQITHRSRQFAYVYSFGGSARFSLPTTSHAENIFSPLIFPPLSGFFETTGCSLWNHVRGALCPIPALWRLWSW